MPRWLNVLLAMGFIVGLIFGVQFAAYALSAVVEVWGRGQEGDLFRIAGLGHLINMVFLMLVFVMVIATMLTLAERKWSAMMQDRVGPNRARFFFAPNAPLAGLPHVITDVFKMLTKEDFKPAAANTVLFWLAPMLAFAPAFALFAVVPAGPTITYENTAIPMVVTNPDFGLLYLFAIASIAVYGTALAGWSANNKFALLGGVRASSQMISYEVALGLSLVGIMIAFSSVQPTTIADGQARYLWQFGNSDFGIPAWGILLQPIGFVLFFAASFAETKRAPFDIPEGESEIIGYFVEYSGMKFGMFMISEFVEVVVLSGVVAVLFFGGWHLPFGEQALLNSWIFGGHPGLLWGAFLGTMFWLKVLFLCWVQLLIRWTFPRFRYDHIQTLGWKMLLPLGLVNVFVSGALILLDPSLRYLAIFGLLQFAVVIGLTFSKPGGAEAGHHHDDHGALAHGTPPPAHGAGH